MTVILLIFSITSTISINISYNHMSYSTSTTQDARKNLSEIISKAAFGNEATVITRSGKNVAVVISYDDYEFYQDLEDKLDGELAMDRLAKNSKRHSHEDVKALLGL